MVPRGTGLQVMQFNKPGCDVIASQPTSGPKGAAADQNAVPTPQRLISQSPAISLPKGGGAIRGMGERFAANPVTGTGCMTVPIATSPGRSGFGPQLSLSYDSGAGQSAIRSWPESLAPMHHAKNRQRSPDVSGCRIIRCLHSFRCGGSGSARPQIDLKGDMHS